MPIAIELQQEIEQFLQADGKDLERHALEGFVVEAFRSGKLSSFEVSMLLGMPDRWSATDFLIVRGAYPGCKLTREEQT